VTRTSLFYINLNRLQKGLAKAANDRCHKSDRVAPAAGAVLGVSASDR